MLSEPWNGGGEGRRRGREGEEREGRGGKRSGLVEELSTKVIMCGMMAALDLETMEAQMRCNPSPLL